MSMFDCIKQKYPNVPVKIKTSISDHFIGFEAGCDRTQ